ncbi:MAG: phage holin family protein [Candidatus Gracilibacteria bacterium]|nr:phage holin family protein [Candidatus Gracilibacteria bacterium]
MKTIFLILLNAIILYVIVILLGEGEIGVSLGCGDTCTANSLDAWKTFIVGGLILGIINKTIKPLLKILSIPFFLLSFGLVSLVINAITLGLLGYIINNILQISGIGYTINRWENFVIAVAIFTILNMVYSVLFLKK